MSKGGHEPEGQVAGDNVYSNVWQTPPIPSDYTLDVITYDRAIDPLGRMLGEVAQKRPRLRHWPADDRAGVGGHEQGSASGHRMPAWVNAAFDDYARRLPREFALELFELKPEPRDRAKTLAKVLAAEAERVAAATKGFLVVALDERGEAWATSQLADKLRAWRDSASPVAFVIGSADGLAGTVKRDADVIMALSALTLPHGLARIVLVEQIYRAASLLRGHPYHRE